MGRADVSVTYVFPLTLYLLIAFPPYKDRKKVFKCLLSILVWHGRNHQICIKVNVRIVGGGAGNAAFVVTSAYHKVGFPTLRVDTVLNFEGE